MPSPGPQPAPPRISPAIFALFVLVALGALWVLSRNWHASLLDRFEFRQLQTATTAFWMQRDGFRLDYPTPLFGPPWSIPMEFPVYQGIVAAASALTGAPLEQTGRFVSVLFFALTFPAVWDLLAVAGLSRRTRIVALCVALLTPVALFYSRAFMIESTATCLGMWFLAALRRALIRPTLVATTVTVLIALLAGLTKITTFAVFCAPAAMLILASLVATDSRGVAALSLRRLMAGALPIAIALGVTLAWVSYGDSVKDSNPYTGFLKSSELRSWNYGSLALRADADFWNGLKKAIADLVLSEGSLALALASAFFASPRARWTAFAGVIGFLSGPTVFANLYHVHDYYYAANALLLTGAAGVLLASAWENPAVPHALKWAALAAMVVFQANAIDRGYGYYLRREPPAAPEIALIARDTLPADDVLLVYADDWNPMYPYYAQRRAITVPGRREDELDVLADVVGSLPPRTIKGMIVAHSITRRKSDFVAARAAQFGLTPLPFAQSDDADFYLAEELVPEAARRLSTRQFAQARLLVSSQQLDDPEMKEQDLSTIAFPMARPAPFRARTRFGVSTGTIDGQTAINAHAPSELYFAPPPGATRVTATVGLPAAAYANPLPAATDGIVVQILEEDSHGLRRVLLRRTLDPARQPGDRGWQEISWDNRQPFTGKIVLKISPGPAGNLTNDWATWTRVLIE